MIVRLSINGVSDYSKIHKKRKLNLGLFISTGNILQTAASSSRVLCMWYLPPVQCQHAHTDVYVGDLVNGARLWSALRWCGSAGNQSRSSRWCWGLHVWPPPLGSSELQTQKVTKTEKLNNLNHSSVSNTAADIFDPQFWAIKWRLVVIIFEDHFNFS